MDDRDGEAQIDSGGAGEAWFVGAVVVGLFFALCRGWYTPEVLLFLSLLVVWNAGIVSTTEALSGFSNPGGLAVGGLFVVMAAIESSKLTDKAAKRVLGADTSFTSGFSRLLACAVSISAFCNNTPVLALLMPVTQDWARVRGFRPPVLLMPLAFACTFGGLLTTVGGGTNLVIQGLLYEAGKEHEGVGPFRLFEPGYVGLPLAVVGVLYLLVAAPRLLAAVREDTPTLGDRSGHLLAEVEIKEDFDLVDRPFSLVLARLGLPIDSLVKVRRRRLPGKAADGKSTSSPVKMNVANGGCHDGSGLDVVGGGSNDFRAVGPGDEELNVLSWAGRIGGRLARRGGKRNPFALRKRASYELLENEDGERLSVTSPGALVPCIEMATWRAEGVVVTAAGKDGIPTPNSGSDGADAGDAHPSGSVQDLYDVAPETCARAGDVLVLSSDRNSMVSSLGSLLGERMEGLELPGLSTLRPPLPGSVFFELVLSRTSHFLGRTARRDNDFFAARYGCRVVAVRLKGSTGGGVDLVGSSSASNRGGSGNSGGEITSVGDRGAEKIGKSGRAWLQTSTSGRRPPSSEAAGTSAAAAAAADVGAVGAIADDGCGEAFLIGGGYDSPMVGGGVGSPFGSTPPTPLLSSSVGEESPRILWKQKIGGQERTSVQESTGEPGLDAKRQRRRPRRRGEAFEAGDVVVVVATERFSERYSSTAAEFLRKEMVGLLPKPTGWFHCFPLAIFMLMLAWVLLGDVDMIRAVFAACAVLLVGGWVDAKQAVGHVNWGVLLLIGSALGFSKAIANSGLAALAARGVRESGMSPRASLYALFGLTLFCTELISNNSAAALNLPMALSMARELEVDYKPFAMTVLIAASCSFLTPIGTPLNTLVWEPGGYMFQDYAKLGAPLTLIFWVFACSVIPWFFPL